MEEFIGYINTLVPLSKKAETAIVDTALYEQLPKGTLLAKEGHICRRFYFLMSGTVRTYFYRDGKDITHWVYPKHHMVTSWYSYITQTPSKDYIETTERCEVVSLTYSQWQELYSTFPELERFGRLVAEEEIALIDDFYKGFYFLSAKEKYQLLTSVIPDITQMANLGHIASMLGISQETLSRVRK